VTKKFLRKACALCLSVILSLKNLTRNQRFTTLVEGMVVSKGIDLSS